MTPYLQRALMLIEQGRHEQAAAELQQLLAEDPNDAYGMSLMALCLSEMGQFDKADQAAANAIGLAPDSAFGFYAASVVSLARNNFKQAKSEINQAIAIDPYDPDFFSQLSVINVQTKDWEEAVNSAEQGLELDPEHADCANCRSLALTKLGRRDEAGQMMNATLQQAPENAFTHANMGWTLLHEGKAKQALPHFKEALRLNPELEFARLGVVEAMKGQFFIYRIFLNWLLLCSRLKAQYMWAIIIGGYIGYRVCLSLLNSHPEWKWVLMPLIGLYLGFVLMTWVAMPLFNLVLKTSKFGRLVLSDQEKRTSNWVGFALLATAGSVVGWAFSGEFVWLAVALSCGLCIPSLGTYYNSDEGWPRAVHGLLNITLLSLCGLMLVSLLGSFCFDGAVSRAFDAIGMLVLTPFFVLAIASQFGVNFLIMARPKKGTNTGRKVTIVGGAILGLLALGLLAFSAFLLFVAVFHPEMMAPKEPPDFISSFSITLDKTDNVAWESPQQLESKTQEFLELGFEQTGDYLSPEQPNWAYRFFLHEDSQLMGTLANVPELRLAWAIGALTTDDRLIEVTSLDFHSHAPDNWHIEFVDGDVPALFEKAIELTNAQTLKKHRPEDLPKITIQHFEQSISFELEREGPTSEELMATGKAIGIETTQEKADLYRRLWRSEVQRELPPFILSRFVERNPDHKNDLDRLYCVNKFTPKIDIIKTVAKLRIDEDEKRSVDDLDEIGSLEQSEDPNNFIYARELFSLFDSVEKIGNLDLPVQTEIYVLPIKSGQMELDPARN